MHVTIPYKSKRPTLYCSTATSEGKKKILPQNTMHPLKPARESEVPPKKLRELRVIKEQAKKKTSNKEKADDPFKTETRKTPPTATATSTKANPMLQSQKIIEEKKREDHKILKNNKVLPPIEKTVSSSVNNGVPKKEKLGVRHIKIRTNTKSVDAKKVSKNGKSTKKRESPAKKDTKKTKHKA